MVKRVSYEEFDEYREARESLRTTFASRSGQRASEKAVKRYGDLTELGEAGLRAVAQRDAELAELEFLKRWDAEGRVYNTGIAPGVRALFVTGTAVNIEREFVPDPPELGCPEIFEVELNEDRVVTGLFLPGGTYDVLKQNSGSSDPSEALVTLYDRAVVLSHNDTEIAGGSGQGHIYRQDHIVEITDSGGAYWAPSRPIYQTPSSYALALSS